MLPSRLWKGFSGAFVRTRTGAGMMWVAGRSFATDFVTPASEQEEMMAEHARTFRFATRFLPGHYRSATIRLYAFFRSLDDLVDESPDDIHSVEEIRRELSDWEQWFKECCLGTPPRSDIGLPLSSVISEYRIPTGLFLDFLEGLKADLNPVTPSTRADVEQYSYQVASTVGISMAHVFGSTSPPAVEAALKLGIAMQLTNILRDVGGDAARNRVYLPESLLHEHGLAVDDVYDQWRGKQGPDHRLVGVLKDMTAWADEHYSAGIDGIRLLPRDVQMPILVAARLYQLILRKLEANGYDSLRQRAATTGWQKLNEARLCVLSLERCLDEAQSRSVIQNSQRSHNPRRSGSGAHAG
jgi:15-cis-phytoene synthase